MAAVAAWLLLPKLERSAFGTALRGTSDNETRAAFLGFETAGHKAVAFAVSGGVAGLAGALFDTKFAFVSPALHGDKACFQDRINPGFNHFSVL